MDPATWGFEGNWHILLTSIVNEDGSVNRQMKEFSKWRDVQSQLQSKTAERFARARQEYLLEQDQSPNKHLQARALADVQLPEDD